MRRVQLVVTGECERVALHLSLRQIFETIEWPTPIGVASFSSTPLMDPLPSGVRDTLDKFANKLIGLVDDADEDTLVIGVDDLELHGDANLLTSAVAGAISGALEHSNWASNETRRARLRARVATQCSFHLLVPMVEAYFFSDAEALARAGAQRASTFDAANHDVEAFQVNDPLFLGPPDSTDKKDWCRGGAQRSRHPKRYLKFLTGNGTPGNWRYRETRDGGHALQSLDWTRVLTNSHFARAARALIEDVADFADEEAFPGDLHPMTARTASRTGRTLRNI